MNDTVTHVIYDLNLIRFKSGFYIHKDKSGKVCLRVLQDSDFS